MPAGDMLRLDTSSSTFRDPWFRALLVLLTIIAALYLGQMVWQLVGQIADLILLFIVAWLISFVLEPTVAALDRIPWLSRTAAVLLVYLALLVALMAGAIVLLPELATQSALAAERLPSLATRIGGWGAGIVDFLAAYGIAVESYTRELLRPIESVGPALMGNALTLATSAASVLVQILLVVVLSIYFMLDGDRLGSTLLRAVPLRYRDDFTYFVSSVYRAFGGFLRGQIIQSLVYGIGIAVIMVAAGLPFVALASVLAGLAIFIPFLGPVLGVLPSVLIALMTDPGRSWLVLLFTVGLNVVVVNVVAPKVMSQQIGLHPIVVLAAVLVGARVLGPWGALFGVPVAAVIAAMVSFYQLTVAERRERVLEVVGSSDTAPEIEALSDRPSTGAPRL